MINTIKTGLLLISLYILCSGFIIYTPTALYTPLLKINKELNMTAKLGLSASGLWNFNAAYALNDNLGITFSGMTSNSNSFITLETIPNSGNIAEFKKNAFEFGGGCFMPYGQKGNRLFQIYSGFGFGSVYDKFTERNTLKYDVESQFVNLFLQVGLAKTGDFFESSFDIKTKHIFVYKIQGEILPYNDGPFSPDYVKLNEKIRLLQVEPVYTFKAGNENLKGIFQFGLILGSGYTDFGYESPSTYNPLFVIANLFCASIGVSYTFRQ